MPEQWYPGAWKAPMNSGGKYLTVEVPDNVLHIAASSWNIREDDPTSTRWGIAGWNTAADATHTYNDEYGNMQQYCALNEVVAGTKDGNYRNRTHEAWNPPPEEGDLNESEYRPAQCERFSDFLAWDHKKNGTLLQDMRNSLRHSHGVGVHRYGITGYNPWNVVGGEIWSASSSKLCPGTARVRQLPGIIARAKYIADNNLGALPPGRVNLPAALARGKKEMFTVGQYEDILSAISTVSNKVASLEKRYEQDRIVHSRVTPGYPNNVAQSQGQLLEWTNLETYQTKKEVQALKEQVSKALAALPKA